MSTSLVLPLRRQIEQVRYVPARNQGDFAPTELISFSTNGFAGFSVARAVAKEFAGLDGRDQGVSSFEGNKVIFRIQVGVRYFVRILPLTESLVQGI